MTPWAVACQAPLSWEFPRQEYWNFLPFLSPGDLPDSRIKPRSCALQVDSLPSEPPGKSVSFEHIMQNATLDELQAGIKTAGRNINNLTYADDTTPVAESEEELKSFLMKVKEEREKAA